MLQRCVFRGLLQQFYTGDGHLSVGLLSRGGRPAAGLRSQSSKWVYISGDSESLSLVLMFHLDANQESQLFKRFAADLDKLLKTQWIRSLKQCLFGPDMTGAAYDNKAACQTCGVMNWN